MEIILSIATSLKKWSASCDNTSSFFPQLHYMNISIQCPEKCCATLKPPAGYKTTTMSCSCFLMNWFGMLYLGTLASVWYSDWNLPWKHTAVTWREISDSISHLTVVSILLMKQTCIICHHNFFGFFSFKLELRLFQYLNFCICTFFPVSKGEL